MSSRKLCIALFMSLILFISSMPNIVWADQTEVSLNHPEGENLTRLTGLMIGGLDEPAEGKPLDENATVTSENGMSWEIPAFWVDENFETALAYQENLSPLLAFYLPEGYTFDGSVLLDDYLTSVFNAIGHVETNYDESTGITFIFGVVNVIYKSFSYGTPGTAAGRNYEEPDDETADDPEWDPDDLGDFEGEDDEEDDGAVNSQSETAAQPDAGQTNNQPAAPASGDDASDIQEDSSGKEETRSLYEQFRDAYADNYKNVDWKKEAERFGGLDQIDWYQMASVIGYDNLMTIYENRQSYCDYITQNGGTEEDCNAMSGKIEASLEKIKPQSEVSDADSETTSAAAMSKRLPAQSGEKNEKASGAPDIDEQHRMNDVLTEEEDTNETDGAAPEGITEGTGEMPQEEAAAKAGDAAPEEMTEQADDAAPEGVTEQTDNTAPEDVTEETDNTAPEDVTEETGDLAPEGPASEKTVVPTNENAAPKAEAPKPESPAPKAEAPKPETPAPKAEAPKPETPAPKAETPKPETPKPETPAPKAEAPKPESPAPKEEASVPEQPAPAGQNDDSVKEESKTPEENTDK